MLIPIFQSKLLPIITSYSCLSGSDVSSTWNSYSIVLFFWLLNSTILKPTVAVIDSLKLVLYVWYLIESLSDSLVRCFWSVNFLSIIDLVHPVSRRHRVITSESPVWFLLASQSKLWTCFWINTNLHLIRILDMYAEVQILIFPTFYLLPKL